MTKNNSIGVVEELVAQIFKMMGVSPNYEVKKDSKNEAIRVDIDAKNEAGLLIGKRGETINSLQHILTLAYKQKVGDWERIIIDVGDWREKQEDYLRNLAFQAAERAKTTGQPQNLYNLSSSQRRIVHMVLSEEKGLVTESQGEGIERYLVVKPANK